MNLRDPSSYLADLSITTVVIVLLLVTLIVMIYFMKNDLDMINVDLTAKHQAVKTK